MIMFLSNSRFNKLVMCSARLLYVGFFNRTNWQTPCHAGTFFIFKIITFSIMNLNQYIFADGEYSDDFFVVAVLFLDQCQLFVRRIVFIRTERRSYGSTGSFYFFFSTLIIHCNPIFLYFLG